MSIELQTVICSDCGLIVAYFCVAYKHKKEEILINGINDIAPLYSTLDGPLVVCAECFLSKQENYRQAAAFTYIDNAAGNYIKIHDERGKPIEIEICRAVRQMPIT